jgi:hypothetical protein
METDVKPSRMRGSFLLLLNGRERSGLMFWEMTTCRTSYRWRRKSWFVLFAFFSLVALFALFALLAL